MRMPCFASLRPVVSGKVLEIVPNSGKYFFRTSLQAVDFNIVTLW
jgi:hypothetical protein